MGNQDSSIKSGQEIVSLIYETVVVFVEGLCPVIKDGKWGFIDKTGTEVLPLIYERVFGCDDGLYGVRKDGKCGFIDYT